MANIDNNDTSLFWEFKGLSVYSDKKFLLSTPFPVIFILSTYLWFVLKSGPEFMKNRKPYRLERVLVIYNFVQVLISLFILNVGIRNIVPLKEAIHAAWNSPNCYSEIKYQQVADGSHWFFLSKLVELLDTVFFVLKKKQRQVSFLHVYHHTFMASFMWCVAKYSAHDCMIFAGFINSIVHISMYSYYGLSVFPALAKYLWWKKYITVIQLVQFCLLFLNIVIGQIVSKCETSYIFLVGISVNSVFFFYLFGDFYLQSYMKEKESKLQNTAVTDTKATPNGN